MVDGLREVMVDFMSDLVLVIEVKLEGFGVFVVFLGKCVEESDDVVGDVVLDG